MASYPRLHAPRARARARGGARPSSAPRRCSQTLLADDFALSLAPTAAGAIAAGAIAAGAIAAGAISAGALAEDAPSPAPADTPASPLSPPSGADCGAGGKAAVAAAARDGGFPVF